MLLLFMRHIIWFADPPTKQAIPDQACCDGNSNSNYNGKLRRVQTCSLISRDIWLATTYATKDD